MSIEVACPACGGSIQIEDVSEVVACPLCQMHLQMDPETSEPVLVTEEEDLEEEDLDPEAALAVDSEQETTESESELNESDVAAEAEASEEESESALAATAEDSPEEASEETESESPQAETASPFAFLPEADQANSEKTQPVRPATNFSFLPGGVEDSEEAETEEARLSTAVEVTNPEEETEAPEENISSEVAESVSEDVAEDTTSAEAVTSEETATTEEETSSEETSSEETSSEETDAGTDTAGESSPEPESPVIQPSYRKGKVVPKRLFSLTLSYAIAATILVAMLLYAKYLGDPHQLESLPDLKPPIKNDEIALQLVPEDATLPAGHILKLGQPGRRFGNVLVTPLRVTRGPLEFEHYTGDATKTRPPSQDVLKLYLKFENVSEDQTFEPIDQKLLLTRVSGKTPESQMRANNFVSRIDQKQTDGERVLIYDMPPSWEWNLKGQNINQEAKPQNLKPGESFETYVATNEAGIDALEGDLVWRLQLRKGYNPKSFRGVTTLIEVVFNSDQIQSETASENQESLPTT